MTNEQHNRDSLIAHIQALDTVIRERNKTIEILREQLKEPIDLTTAMEKKIQTAYLKGFKACYRIVQQETSKQRVQLLDAIYEVMS